MIEDGLTAPSAPPALQAAARQYCIEHRMELRRIRRAKELSLDQVAKEIGVAHIAVHWWESGRNSPIGSNALAWLECVYPEAIPLLEVVITSSEGAANCSCL